MINVSNVTQTMKIHPTTSPCGIHTAKSVGASQMAVVTDLHTAVYVELTYGRICARLTSGTVHGGLVYIRVSLGLVWSKSLRPGKSPA